jgi:hypothetical protein
MVERKCNMLWMDNPKAPCFSWHGSLGEIIVTCRPFRSALHGRKYLQWMVRVYGWYLHQAIQG